eukprot:m.317814 g.317814  ORF g.317814 m.317814 type:complete len:420 (-) comp15987_c1_seq2:3625-4884(-)
MSVADGIYWMIHSETRQTLNRISPPTSPPSPNEPEHKNIDDLCGRLNLFPFKTPTTPTIAMAMANDGVKEMVCGAPAYRGHGKLRYFFPRHRHVHSQLYLDEEALYSVTEEHSATAMTSLLAMMLPQGAPVLDGTACVGGNAANLARTFNTYACEMSPARAELLRRNLSALRVRAHVLVDDVVRLLQPPSQDSPPEAKATSDSDPQPDAQRDAQPKTGSPKQSTILPAFLGALTVDPPWGGVEYHKTDEMELFLSGLNMAQFCQMASTRTNVILLKVPHNYAFRTFVQAMQDWHGGQDTVTPYILQCNFKKFSTILIVFERTPQQLKQPQTAAAPSEETATSEATAQSVAVPDAPPPATIPTEAQLKQWATQNQTITSITLLSQGAPKTIFEAPRKQTSAYSRSSHQGRFAKRPPGSYK